MAEFCPNMDTGWGGRRQREGWRVLVGRQETEWAGWRRGNLPGTTTMAALLPTALSLTSFILPPYSLLHIPAQDSNCCCSTSQRSTHTKGPFRRPASSTVPFQELELLCETLAQTLCITHLIEPETFRPSRVRCNGT